MKWAKCSSPDSHGPHDFEVEGHNAVETFHCGGRDVLGPHPHQESEPTQGVDNPEDSPAGYLKAMGFDPPPEVSAWLERNAEDLAREGMKVSSPLVLAGMAMTRHSLKQAHDRVRCEHCRGAMEQALKITDGLVRVAKANSDMSRVPPEGLAQIEEWLS